MTGEVESKLEKGAGRAAPGAWLLFFTTPPQGTLGFLSILPEQETVALSNSSHGPDLAARGSNRVPQGETSPMRRKILPLL